MTDTETTYEDPRAAAGARSLELQPFLFVVLSCDHLTLGGARYALAKTDTVAAAAGESFRSVPEHVPIEEHRADLGSHLTSTHVLTSWHSHG